MSTNPPHEYIRIYEYDHIVILSFVISFFPSTGTFVWVGYPLTPIMIPYVVSLFRIINILYYSVYIVFYISSICAPI